LLVESPPLGFDDREAEIAQQRFDLGFVRDRPARQPPRNVDAQPRRRVVVGARHDTLAHPLQRNWILVAAHRHWRRVIQLVDRPRFIRRQLRAALPRDAERGQRIPLPLGHAMRHDEACIRRQPIEHAMKSRQHLAEPVVVAVRIGEQATEPRAALPPEAQRRAPLVQPRPQRVGMPRRLGEQRTVREFDDAVLRDQLRPLDRHQVAIDGAHRRRKAQPRSIAHHQWVRP
jgi:hypothetical protein